LIGATNEKPRLREQPGFSSIRLRELILPNLARLERACGDDIQAKAACSDHNDSLSKPACVQISTFLDECLHRMKPPT
jgi:hypothetical protein